MNSGPVKIDPNKPKAYKFGIVLVSGFSRSGTSWLAKIMDTCPDVMFVNEPDKRTHGHLKFGRVEHCCRPDDDNMRVLYQSSVEELFHSINFTLDYHPVFDKNFRKFGSQYGRILLLGKILDKIAFRATGRQISLSFPMFRTGEVPTLLWKSVNQSSNLPFLSSTFPGLKVIHILRNPYSAIASALKNDLMSLDGQDDRRLMERRNSSFFQKSDHANFLDNLESLTELQKRALLWRVNNESAIEWGQQSGDFYLVKYEDLVKNLNEEVENLFRWLGWSYQEPTRNFLEKSTGSHGLSLLERVLSKSYYGVFRKAGHKAKTALSEEQKNEIDSVLAPSFLMEMYQ